MKVRILCCLALLISASTALAQEITVAAAADLQFVFPEVATRFEKSTGHPVKLSFGSSGNFFAQIQNGAPFDLFFSADIDYPKKLEGAGQTEPNTLYQYAVGKIVLWVPNSSKLDLGKGLSALLDPTVKKIAIANPEHAPYGRAAVAALRQEKLYDQVSAELVVGENISQAATFVVSGSADAGIVALSLALSPPMKEKGRYVEVPSSDYPPLEQAAIVLKSSTHKEIARQLLSFLQSPEIVDLLRTYGFAIPGAPAKAK